MTQVHMQITTVNYICWFLQINKRPKQGIVIQNKGKHTKVIIEIKTMHFRPKQENIKEIYNEVILPK